LVEFEALFCGPKGPPGCRPVLGWGGAEIPRAGEIWVFSGFYFLHGGKKKSFSDRLEKIKTQDRKDSPGKVWPAPRSKSHSRLRF